MRGVQYGNMIISPFQYNPVTNVLKVYNNLVFEISFKHPDIALTESMKEKYFSPYFQSSLSKLINYEPPQSKDVLSKYPIKYVIISLTSFQTTLQPFVKWKTKKGFKVIEQYYPTAPTTASIKTYLQGLYTAGTASDPAPTFVLLVGDVAQIPTYTGVADATHKTDLYYCTFDGLSDYIPDMYYGRFSATTVAQLQPQIDKTLEYEQYLMPNPSYLDSVVMIAGVDDGSQPDGGFSQIHANGQINYGTTNYFNAAHGIYSFTYLWPVTNNASTDVSIRNNIGTGVSYANYTAHGSSTGWADPSFQTSDIASMHNNHKYCLMVGNCCQTNTFNDTECFGEALLRAANKGAVGYIGASNYSYWDEDYYFGVGSRASIVEFPTYEASNLGAYDRMFHDHGELTTSWFYTNDQMVYAGNLAVEASASTMKKYYWEIYHLMGDPSVMTYFSVPDPLPVAYPNPQSVGISTLQVTTLPDAYVAITHNGTWLDARLADATGIANLSFPAFSLPDTADIVVTKQNRQPYIGKLYIVAASLPLDAELVSIVEPQTTYNCTNIDVTPKVIIRNMGTTTLTSLKITYQVSGGSAQIYNWSGSMASLACDTIPLSQITIAAGSFTFTATTSLPNNGTDQNTANDSKVKSYTASNLPVSSDFSADATQYCNAPASIPFTNNSTNALTYLWDFGDGSSSTETNPTHNYTLLGTYNVVLTSYAGICGNDVETKTSYVTVGAASPITTDASRCGVGSVSLFATGAGTINWYDAPTSGNLITSGTSYNTPSLSATTTYYVEQVMSSPSEYGGKTDSVGGGAMYNTTTYWLLFDCSTAVNLKSVKVYASVGGNRTITLNSSSNAVLQTITVNIPAGTSRVTLNFPIPVGTGMSLRCTATPNMYRSSGGIIFPYNVGGKISITGTNASTTRYYFFYDWEIESPSCSSALIPVTATIYTSPAYAAFTLVQNNNDVTFTNTSTNGGSYFWDFGDGNTSNATNPLNTYTANGTFHVMLITTNDCNSDTAYNDVVITTTGIEENSLGNIEVYPNPTNSVILIKLNNTVVNKIVLTDIIGKELLKIDKITEFVSIDLSKYNDGVYFVRFMSTDKIINHRITKTK